MWPAITGMMLFSITAEVSAQFTVADSIRVRNHLEFIQGRTSPISGSVDSYIYRSKTGGTSYPFTNNGHLVFQPRSNSPRDIVFLTGNPTPVPVMNIRSSGNVGMGTNFPQTTLHVKSAFFRLEEAGSEARTLDIYPAISGQNHRFTSATTSAGFSFENNAGTLMTLTSSASIGIGRTNPTYKLDVLSDDPFLRLTDDEHTTRSAGIMFNTNGGQWELQSGIGSGTDSNLNITRANVKRFTFDRDIYAFKIYNNDAAERVRLRANGTSYLNGGYVGIGVSSPESKLHVQNSNVGVKSNYSDMVIEDTDAHLDLVSSAAASWGSAINFVEGNGSTNTDIWSIARQTTGQTGDSSLRFNFGTNNQHNNPTLVIFKADGKVGIGTANPSVDLEVVDVVESHIRATESTNNRYVQIYQQANDSYLISGGSAGNYGNLRFYAGGTDRMIINPSGNIGIGTTTPDQKLTVDGTVKSEEVIVEENVGADFVFEEDYDLPSLSHIESFIKTNKHLEGIPSAEDMKKDGVKVGELQIKLLQKIEELTLHMIRLQKENDQLKTEIKELKNDKK